MMPRTLPQRLLCFLLLGLWWAAAPTRAWAQPGGTVAADSYFEGSLLYKIDVQGDDGQQVYKMNALTNMQQHFHRTGSFIIQLWGDVNAQQQELVYDPMNPMETPPSYYPTTRLYLADSNWMYQLNMEEFEAYRFEGYTPDEDVIPTAIPTGKIVQVLNLPCHEFRVDKPEETIYYYVHPKYRVDLIGYQKLSNARANFLTKGLQGCIPLKTVRKSKKLDMTTTTTCVKVEQKKYDVGMFRLPPNITLKGRDPMR